MLQSCRLRTADRGTISDIATVVGVVGLRNCDDKKPFIQESRRLSASMTCGSESIMSLSSNSAKRRWISRQAGHSCMCWLSSSEATFDPSTLTVADSSSAAGHCASPAPFDELCANLSKKLSSLHSFMAVEKVSPARATTTCGDHSEGETSRRQSEGR